MTPLQRGSLAATKRGEATVVITTVVQSTPDWLRQTQTWIHTQVDYTPSNRIESHVVCERVINLDQFPVQHPRRFAEAPTLERLYDRSLRKLGLRPHLGYLPRVARQVGAGVIHSNFGDVGWADSSAAAAAFPILQVLGLLGFFYSLGNPLGALLFAKGRPDLDFYLNVWRAMHYAGAIGLGMNWGLQGVASALVFATAGGMFPLGFWLRKWLVEMTVAEYLRAFAPMLAASAAAAVGFAAELVIGSSEKLLIVLPLRALVYLVLILPSQRSFFGRLRDTVR